MASISLSATPVATTSSFSGRKLQVQRVSLPASRITRRITSAPRAKYGDESIYFDLKDLGNTTGAWDLYGSDSKSPYNGLQSTFFETFAGLFSKRGILLKVLILGYAGAIGHFAANSTGDVLPIKKGPQTPATPGPRGRL